MPDDKIEIENFTSPGRTERVNRAKYEAMRDALLAVLPDAAPGLTVPEAKAALLALASGCPLSGRRQGRLVAEGGAAGP
jgi:hypothetical protein